MPHQHVHNLTPYPHSAEGSAFPFPTIPAKQSPMQLQPQRTPSSSSSTSSSYASFRYPTPHAQSYPSASFPLKLSTIHSPVPPSLLQRRRSSCCTVSSMDSLASASTTSTSSWGNWSVESPVPGLSRSGSSSSRTGAGVGEDLKTPETVLFGDFEDEISHNVKLNAEQRREEHEEEEEDFAHSHSGLVSAMKMKKSTMARPRLFVKLAEPEQKTSPRLQRTQTPLELWTMRSQRSAPVPEEEMEMKEEDITAIKATTRTTKATSTTTPTRPKLERKLTPHPATGPASTQHLKGAFPSTTSGSDFAFEGLVLNEVDEDEQAESSEERAEDEEEEKSTRPSNLWDISLPPATRGRPIHRMALGRRFSSVIEEGKVWLAV